MGNTGRKPSVSEALANPDIKVGDMVRSSGNGPGGQTLYQAWRWNGEDWIKVSEQAWNRWLADTTRADFLDGTEINSTIIEVGPLGGKLPSNAPDCYRWPSDSLDTGADYVFFQNSGAEATEAAIKFARRYFYSKGQPRKNRILCINNSFHGRTLATIFASNSKKAIEGFGPKVDGFDHFNFGDHKSLEKSITSRTAAIMVETIMGEGGIKAVSYTHLTLPTKRIV